MTKVQPPKFTLKFDEFVDTRLPSCDGEDKEEEEDEDEIWACLERVCAQLNYTPTMLRDMLTNETTFPPPEIMALVKAQLGSSESADDAKIKPVLRRQRKKVLMIVNKGLKDAEEGEEMTAEEKALDDRLSAIGLCPAGFRWHREGHGWRCGGGSHYVTQEQFNKEYCKVVQ